jgi:hypothetical protein
MSHRAKELEQARKAKGQRRMIQKLSPGRLVLFAAIDEATRDRVLRLSDQNAITSPPAFIDHVHQRLPLELGAAECLCELRITTP